MTIERISFQGDEAHNTNLSIVDRL